MSNIFDDAFVIFRYTRKQAIDDGVLIDITSIAALHGCRIPVACTCGVYSECGEHLAALLDTLRAAIDAAGRSDRVTFRLDSIALWAICGPGDNAEPVLTIMLEGED